MKSQKFFVETIFYWKILLGKQLNRAGFVLNWPHGKAHSWVIVFICNLERLQRCLYSWFSLLKFYRNFCQGGVCRICYCKRGKFFNKITIEKTAYTPCEKTTFCGNFSFCLLAIVFTAIFFSTALKYVPKRPSLEGSLLCIQTPRTIDHHTVISMISIFYAILLRDVRGASSCSNHQAPVFTKNQYLIRYRSSFKKWVVLIMQNLTWWHWWLDWTAILIIKLVVEIIGSKLM